jgi:hypothetical protein
VVYIPRSIFHLARLLYVRPETFGPTLVCFIQGTNIRYSNRAAENTACNFS